MRNREGTLDEMKIGFISVFPPQMDGIADYSFFLVESMSKTCKKCDFYVIAPTLLNIDKEIHSNERIQLFRVWDMSSTYKSLSSILRIIKIIIEKKFDILHVQYRFTREQGGSVGEPFFILFFILRMMLKKTKIAVTLHDFWSPVQIEKRMRELSRSRSVARLYKFYYTAYVRLMLSLPHLIFSIVNGERSRNTEFVRKYAKSEVIEVLHGLPNVEQMDKRTRLKYKKALGVEDKFTILLFGFIRKEKGYEYVFRALGKIFESEPTAKERVRVFLVGATLFPEDEAYLNYLKNLVEEIGLEKITQIVPRHVDYEEIAGFYGATDITILSNTQRVGPSGVLFLSLAHDVPLVITSDTAFITSKSNIPALVVSLNVDEIASSITNLMKKSSIYAEQVQKIRRYKLNHTNQRINSAHLNAYHRLLQQ